METTAMAILSRIVSLLVSVIFAASGIVSPALSQQVNTKNEKFVPYTYSSIITFDSPLAKQSSI